MECAGTVKVDDKLAVGPEAAVGVSVETLRFAEDLATGEDEALRRWFCFEQVDVAFVIGMLLVLSLVLFTAGLFDVGARLSIGAFLVTCVLFLVVVGGEGELIDRVPDLGGDLLE